MKLGADSGPIFPGSEHQQVLPRQQFDSGEKPLAEISRVIGEAPAIEIDRRRSLVLDLDPIR